MSAKIDWSRLARELLPASPALNLNAGTCSPTPTPILMRAEALRRELASDPVHFFWRTGFDLLEAARAALARYLAVDPRHLLLTVNATQALGAVIASFPFERDDEVILTDQEYHHYLALWRRIAHLRGIKLKTVTLPLAFEEELSPATLVDRITQAFSTKTRMVFVSHVTSATGLVLPVRDIALAARARGIVTVIDGAHAPGMLPLALSEIDADFYAGNCHKWLMAPVGAGFMHVRPESRRWLHPLIWTEFCEYEPSAADVKTAAGSTHWTLAHEYLGTQDRVPQMVLPELFEFRARLGEEAMRARMEELAARTRARLTGAGFALASQTHERLKTSLIAVRIPEVDTQSLWRWFREERGIELAFPSLGPGRALMRVSNAWWNAPEDLDRLLEALGQVDWERFSPRQSG